MRWQIDKNTLVNVIFVLSPFTGLGCPLLSCWIIGCWCLRAALFFRELPAADGLNQKLESSCIHLLSPHSLLPPKYISALCSAPYAAAIFLQIPWPAIVTTLLSSTFVPGKSIPYTILRVIFKKKNAKQVISVFDLPPGFE